MGYTPGVYEQTGVDCFSQRGEMLYVDTPSPEGGAKVFVQMTLSRVIDKMVVDEGRALQPCRYR